MPKFSQLSLDRLKSCHPDLQTLFNEVIRTFDCIVLEGYRNEVDQNKAFDAGKSKLRFPNGKHNSSPSMAVDVAPFPVDWKNLNRFYWFSGYVLGMADLMVKAGRISHVVRWGGDWTHNYDITDEKGLSDLVHFELIS